MNLDQWNLSVAPLPMLDFLWTRRVFWERQDKDAPRLPSIDDRQSRLFAVACCRQVWHDFEDECSRDAVLAAERFADGVASFSELEHHYQSSRHESSQWATAGISVCNPYASEAARATSMYAATGRDDFCTRSLKIQSDLLRCIIGNPYRMRCQPHGKRCDCVEGMELDSTHILSTCKKCQGSQWATPPASWLSSPVIDLAKAIYDANDFERVPYLNDALEEAGCDNVFIVHHLRGLEACGHPGRIPKPGPHAYEFCKFCDGTHWQKTTAPCHVRGCWAIDALRGAP